MLINRLKQFALLFWVLWLVACSQTPTPTVPSTITVVTATPYLTTTSSPTATPYPDFAAVELDGEIIPSEVAPNQSLIWHFNQPMNSQSSDTPILFSFVTGQPKGTFSWNDTITTLTFTPAEDWAENRVFTAAIDPQLQTATGLLFSSENLPKWPLTISKRPYIKTFAPQQLTSTNRLPQFKFTFNEPMNQGSMAEGLILTPEVEHEISWEENTAIVQLVEPLPAEVSLKVQLSDVVQNSAGVPMKPRQWQYKTEPLLKSLVTPSSKKEPVVVEFNYPVDPEQVQEMWQIVPNMEGELVYSPEQQRLTFTPAERWPIETSYTIQWAGELTDPEGYSLGASPVLELPGYMPVLATYPTTPVAPAAIQLTFADPVDQASVETAFSVTPAVEGTFSWEGNKISFNPTAGVLPPQTSYTVKVENTALASDGQKLFTAPYQWSFTTAQPTPSDVIDLGRGLKYQTLNSEGNRQIYFTASTISQVEIRLVPVTVLELIESYQAPGDSLENASLSSAVAYSWSMETPLPETDESGTTQPIHTLTIPAEVPPGIYLLTVGENLYQANQLMVVITDQRIALKQGDSQFSFWLSTFQNQVISGATFTIYGQDKQVLTSGQTDEFGFFEAKLDVEKEQPLFATAEANGQLSFIGFSEPWNQEWPFWGRCCRDYSTIYPLYDNNPYEVYFWGDKPIYRPGETVHYQAIIRLNEDAVLTTPPVNTPFSVRVWGHGRADSYETIEQYTARMLGGEVTELLTDEFGVITGSFVIPAEGAHTGYEIELLLYDRPADWEPYWYWDKNPRLIVTVLEDEQNYVVKVELDKTSFIAGEEAKATISVTDLAGQPVPNLPLTLQSVLQGSYSDWYMSTEITSSVEFPAGQTDESGQYQFTFSPIFSSDNVDDVNRWFLIASVKDENKTSAAVGGQFYLVNNETNLTPTLELEKDVYNPYSKVSIDLLGYTAGDTVQLTVQSNITGPAWLTIERSTVQRQQLIQLTSPNTIISLPIEAEDTPNIFVTVGWWQPVSTPQNPTTQFNFATPSDAYWVEESFSIEVLTGKLLNVEVVPDKAEYRPGETASFNIQVTDFNGQPVAAGVTLAIADVMCQELNPPSTSHPFHMFYRSRRHLVKTFDSVRYRLLNEGEPSGGGGWGGKTTPEPVLIPCQNSAGWLPNIQTGANGQATVQFTLPHQVVNWQVTATAVTAETHVGQTATQITVKP